MKRRWLALVGFVLAMIVIAAVAVPYVEPHRLARHESELRAQIQRNITTATVVAYLAYTLVSLVPGTSGKSIIAGWLLGFWIGLAVVVAGLTSAALIVLVVTRYALRDAIQQRFGAKLRLWDKWLEREGAWFLLTLRMAHVPFSLVNYLSAASRVSVRTFLWTTAVGLLPGSVVFVWMGSRLPTLDALIDRGAKELLDPWLGAALLATASLPLIVRWFVRWIHRGQAESLVEEEIHDIDELAGDVHD